MNVTRWLTTSILVAPYSSATSWGSPGYGAAVRRAARVVWDLEVDPEGDRERGMVTARVLTAAALNPKDRVWLPTLAMVAPLDADASDVTKARTVEQCTPGVSAGSGRVVLYETRL